MLPVAMARPSVGGAVVVLYYSHNSAFVNDVVCITRSGKEAWTHRRFFLLAFSVFGSVLQIRICAREYIISYWQWRN